MAAAAVLQASELPLCSMAISLWRTFWFCTMSLKISKLAVPWLGKQKQRLDELHAD